MWIHHDNDKINRYFEISLTLNKKIMYWLMN